MQSLWFWSHSSKSIRFCLNISGHRKPCFCLGKETWVRHLDRHPWSSSIELTLITSGSLDPWVVSETLSLLQGAEALVVGQLGAGDWPPLSIWASPGPRPEPRSWPLRLVCPSAALKSNHHESCEASLLKSQNHSRSEPPPQQRS